MQQLHMSGTCIALLFHFLLSSRPLQTASNEKRKLFLKTKYVEAATRGVLCERVFLEISQNSQENTCARVSFSIKLQDRVLQLY